ncbi:MAG: hypothetical protein K8R21_12410 [Leptospira sp.]|nr:hypothetical protein [Leptospira sp.]
MTTFALLAIIKAVHSLGDIGVMLAVGGNRIGCILILMHKDILLLLSGYLLAFIVQIFALTDSVWAGISIRDIFLNLINALGQSLLISLSATIIAGFFITSIDPYQAIRRQK